jgi:ribosomal protein L11 methyltransferase
MSWLQLELETDQIHAEELSVLLAQLGVISVSLTASSSEPIFDEDDKDKALWHKTRLTVLLNPKYDIDSLLVQLHNHVGSDAIYSYNIKLLKDKDWVNEFKSKYQPIFFSDQICISPSWCQPSKNTIPTIILDPGLAFGTGFHPTTSLCIEWLCKNDISDKIVIDYGCGSGILAMVALKLGAKKVYAIDIDEQALKTARENIEQNKLQEKILVSHPENIVIPTADILVANILQNPLEELAKEFSNLTKSGSHIILSGLLSTQAAECLAVYSADFKMDKPVLRKNWASLYGVKL